MLKATELREAVFNWIEHLPSGKRFSYNDAYNFLENSFASECSLRGDEKNEPRYRHDARFAVWDAQRKGLVKHTGARGQRQRC